MAESDDPGPACPVDQKTRDAWMAQARQAQDSPAQPASACPVPHTPPPPASSSSWTSRLASHLPWAPTPAPSPTSHASASPSTPPGEPLLDTDRVISSIPRSIDGHAGRSLDHGASANAANHELESGADASGNWVYPSEKMFFDAMKRKGYDARTVDMKTVVPIHNAVNERAWRQILDWEAPHLAGSTCGGPKLESFANKSDCMSPTARINTIFGYTAPFDRHDWVVDRCGTRIEYVIDFYAGRPDGRPGPSFYLDVRPKLNSWQGFKMRAMRWAGIA